MADAKKPKEVLFVSPKGAAKWAKLNAPDTKYKAEGAYSVELILDPNDADTIAFVAKIEAAHETGFAAAQKAEPKKKLTKMPLKIKEEMKKVKGATAEDDTLVPTGKTQASFACKASGVRKKDNSKWTFKPALFDASVPAKPLPADLVIFGGSTIRVSYSIRHTAMQTGLFYTSLNLKAVKVLKLASMSSRDASEYGFEDEAGFESGEPTGEEGSAPVDGAQDF